VRNVSTSLDLAVNCLEVRARGGRALIVGGWVRDRLLGGAPRPRLEVFASPRISSRRSLRVRSAWRPLTGFPVYIFRSGGVGHLEEIVVALPRRESKIRTWSQGLRGSGDPFMSLEDAARRP